MHADMKRGLVVQLEHCAIVRAKFAIIVHPRGAEMGVALPFQHFGDVCALVQGIGYGNGPGRPRPEPVDADAYLLPKVF